MQYCRNCGKEIGDDAYFCPHCGVASNETKMQPQKTNQTNTLSVIGLIFAFFIPLVGLICSICGLKKADEDYGGNGKGLARAGIIVSVIMMVLSIIVSIAISDKILL